MESARKAPDPDFVLRTKTPGITCISDGEIWNGVEVMFSGSADGLISVWDIKQRRTIHSFCGHLNNSVLKIARLKHGNILSHGRDGNIIKWKILASGAVIEEQFNVYQLGFCPVSEVNRGEDLFIGFQANADSQVDVVNLSCRKNILELKPAEKLGMVMQLKLFEDKESHDVFAFIGYEDGSVALWDVLKCEMRKRLKIYNDAVMCLDVDEDHTKAVIGSADNRLVQIAISTASEEALNEIRSVEFKSQGTASVKIRPDGRIVAVGCWDGKIRIFGWKKLKPLAILQYHTETVNCVEFLKNNCLACGSKDGKISLWSIYTES